MRSSGEYKVALTINNEERRITVSSSESLLNMIRTKFGLTGAKPGCLNGDCGACTVMVDQDPIKSCMMLAVEAEGKCITTIEGLSHDPIQEAFIDHFAFQCGYCTPGFIMNIRAMLLNHPDADPCIIKEWLGSNICRCTGYKEIEEAVKSVLGNSVG
ncbi:(2Fe-2S)-binding protein [Falsibacillus albus]|uniref:(2Fe-2S)-binding protein n=1 Tax=Falsibacillus albus TaxID=2478915 RepID=A0A3L7JZ31_9BACI|nr:(2Fe-2S)-binding protein [Falsibacillus albus]RLQ95534.1 (2Fe-2S)-binding protein [Falsibacillus albus]